ncbi:hypothetical protein [Mycolicibacterium sp. XJ879]
MKLIAPLMMATAVVAPALSTATSAAADDVVTYEIYSNVVRTTNIEYRDGDRKTLVPSVPLPWRIETVVAGGPGRAEVRADWRPGAWPNKWVTVRIVHRGDVLCQSTLDIGNATCYGNTPHFA